MESFLHDTRELSARLRRIERLRYGQFNLGRSTLEASTNQAYCPCSFPGSDGLGLDEPLMKLCLIQWYVSSLAAGYNGRWVTYEGIKTTLPSPNMISDGK